MSKIRENTYILPTLQALLLHTVVFILFLSSWNVVNSQEETKFAPKIVNARILSVDPIAARQRAEEEKRKEKAKRDAEKKRKAKAKRKRDQEKKRAEKKKLEQKKAADQKKLAEKKRLAEKKKKEEQKRNAEKKRKRIEAEQLAKMEREKEEQLERELAKERELEIAKALNKEEDFLLAQTDAEEAMAYVGMIQERVKQNWHRPLSARNGMQALLMINLVPTGEVNQVVVLEGSGDPAFDRSAVQAVQRAEKFEELQNLSPRVFDAKFRQFRMLFKPEDLDR